LLNRFQTTQRQNGTSTDIDVAADADAGEVVADEAATDIVATGVTTSEITDSATS
jgi:hypothetical protein